MPLLFLMKLQRVRLPVRLTYPEDVRDASVLLATGLIEATIVALDGRKARYNSGRHVATVHRITADGLKEITALGNLPALAGASLAALGAAI